MSQKENAPPARILGKRQAFATIAVPEQIRVADYPHVGGLQRPHPGGRLPGDIRRSNGDQRSDDCGEFHDRLIFLEVGKQVKQSH